MNSEGEVGTLEEWLRETFYSEAELSRKKREKKWNVNRRTNPSPHYRILVQWEAVVAGYLVFPRWEIKEVQLFKQWAFAGNRSKGLSSQRWFPVGCMASAHTFTSRFLFICQTLAVRHAFSAEISFCFDNMSYRHWDFLLPHGDMANSGNKLIKVKHFLRKNKI